MIIIVAHEQKDWRATQIAVTLKEWKESEPIMLDDTTATFADLEGYCYPSLFSLSVPIVHAKYLLPTAVAQFNTTLVKNLSASPTVFLFEEFALATPIATAAKNTVLSSMSEKKFQRKNQKTCSERSLASSLHATRRVDGWHTAACSISSRSKPSSASCTGKRGK
jgi:hypothetical protein